MDSPRRIFTLWMPGAVRTGRMMAACLWQLLVRNRLAIAVASLVWLILRSGTKPSRFAYPCQQVAVLNVGAILTGLVPALFLVRKQRQARNEPAWVAWRRQCVIAVLLFITALVGVEGFQYAGSLQPTDLPQAGPSQANPQPTTVGIAHQDPAGSEFTQQEIDAMVARAVELAGGLESVVSSGDHVVLKPNLVQSMGVDGREGVVTDPRVCWAVAKLAQAAGASRVTIAEGTAVGTTGRNCTWEAMTNAGYDANSDQLFDFDPTIDLFDLNDSGGLHQTDPAYVTEVTLNNGVLRSSWYIPNILLECDVLISVPTFKNHWNGTVTLAMKNRVGTVPNDIYHEDDSWGGGVYGKMVGVHRIDEGFACDVTPCPSPSDENEIVQRAIVDLNLARPQDFAVVDGLVGITNGPNGTPFRHPNPYMHLIAAGRDSVAVDATCTLAMRYDPLFVRHLAYADANGTLGTFDPRYITVKGDHVMAVRSDDFPNNHGTDGAVYTELNPPSLTDVSWTPGQQIVVSEAVDLTIYGAHDDVGVIKAEVAMVPTASPDAVPEVFTLFNPAPKDPASSVWPALDTSGALNMVFDATGLDYGEYEATITVYDAAMNEADLTRTINLVPPSGPVLLVEPSSLENTVFVSETPAAQNFTVRNIGVDTMCYSIAVSDPGPSVSPDQGCIDAGAPGDVIAVNYDDFGPGLAPTLTGHAATLTVDAGAIPNSPQDVGVNLIVTTVGPDLDTDGDVDMDDFGTLQACMATAGQIPSPDCQAGADFDGNNAIDSADLGVFKNCMSGAHIPPDKTCDD